MAVRGFVISVTACSMASAGIPGLRRSMRRTQAPDEEDLGLVVAAERPVGPERLVVGVDVLPAELLEQLDRGLLDELVLGVPARRAASRSSLRHGDVEVGRRRSRRR